MHFSNEPSCVNRVLTVGSLRFCLFCPTGFSTLATTSEVTTIGLCFATGADLRPGAGATNLDGAVPQCQSHSLYRNSKYMDGEGCSPRFSRLRHGLGMEVEGSSNPPSRIGPLCAAECTSVAACAYRCKGVALLASHVRCVCCGATRGIMGHQKGSWQDPISHRRKRSQGAGCSCCWRASEDRNSQKNIHSI